MKNRALWLLSSLIFVIILAVAFFAFSRIDTEFQERLEESQELAEREQEDEEEIEPEEHEVNDDEETGGIPYVTVDSATGDYGS